MPASEPTQPDDAVPSPARPTGRLHWGPPWLAPATHRTQIDMLELTVAGLMLVIGTLFFGWRGLLSAAAAAVAAVASYLLAGLPMHAWRTRRVPDSVLHVLGMGLLLGACLPVLRQPMIAIAGGLVLGLTAHVAGRSHKVRVSPVVVALVLAWLLPDYLGRHNAWPARLPAPESQEAVLGLDHMARGDLLKCPTWVYPVAWWEAEDPAPYDALRRPVPITVLMENQQAILTDGSVLAKSEKMTGGPLCRVEELLIGCVPGPMGGTSRAIIILLGFYLMYRRLSWWPVPLLAVAGALGTFVLMPVQVEGHWGLVAGRLMVMGPELSFIFLGYVVLASPLLLVSMILAPGSAPMSGRGKVVYALVLGAAFILSQWFLALPESGYLGLLVAGLLARPLDGLRGSPFVGK